MPQGSGKDTQVSVGLNYFGKCFPLAKYNATRTTIIVILKVLTKSTSLTCCLTTDTNETWPCLNTRFTTFTPTDSCCDTNRTNVNERELRANTNRKKLFGACIDERLYCDDKQDCPNGADENFRVPTRTFRCNGTFCLQLVSYNS